MKKLLMVALVLGLVFSLAQVTVADDRVIQVNIIGPNTNMAIELDPVVSHSYLRQRENKAKYQGYHQ
jgi:hypothetical protein